MTELNSELDSQPSPETQPAGDAEPESADTRVDWPSVPESAGTQDPTVSALLERLRQLPELPVADHGEVYEGLHDDLMEALNEDVSGNHPAAQPNAAGGFAE